MNNNAVFDKLASLMDDYNKKYFIQLGEWLVTNKHVNERLRSKLPGLKKNFQGGGSPTMAIFEADAARCPDRGINEQLQFAKNETRKDVSNIVKEFIQKNPKVTKVSQLDLITKQKIADLLDVPTHAIKGWDALAAYFGFNKQERHHFKISYVVPGEFSPTQELFQLLKHENDSLSVKLIIEWSRSVPYDEVTQLLSKFFHDQIQP